MSSVDAPPAQSVLTPAALETGLARLGPGESATQPEAERLAARVRDWFGAEALRAGPDPQIEELTVAWAIRADPGGDTRVRVLADDGSFALPLTRLGSTDVFAGAATLPSGTAFRWSYEVTQGVTQGATGRRTLLPDVP